MGAGRCAYLRAGIPPSSRLEDYFQGLGNNIHLLMAQSAKYIPEHLEPGQPQSGDVPLTFRGKLAINYPAVLGVGAPAEPGKWPGNRGG